MSSNDQGGFKEFQKTTLIEGEKRDLYQEDAGGNFSKKTRNGLCKLFIHSKCNKSATECKFSHSGSRIKPCHHFQFGNCRKGDDCDFSHNMEPEKKICRFIRDKGVCTKGSSCTFKHVLKPCKKYDKGFCEEGEDCKHTHIPKKLCKNYAYGFCPEGPNCEDAHPKLFTVRDKSLLESLGLKVIECYHCKEIGHKSTICNQEINLNDPIYCFKCNKRHAGGECLLE